jgi:hypothetical protein
MKDDLGRTVWLPLPHLGSLTTRTCATIVLKINPSKAGICLNLPWDYLPPSSTSGPTNLPLSRVSSGRQYRHARAGRGPRLQFLGKPRHDVEPFRVRGPFWHAGQGPLDRIDGRGRSCFLASPRVVFVSALRVEARASLEEGLPTGIHALGAGTEDGSYAANRGRQTAHRD